MTLLKRTQNSSVQDWKHYEMKVVEEYYWAITHAAADHFPVWWSLDFKWTLLYARARARAHTHTHIIYIYIYTEIRLAKNSTCAGPSGAQLLRKSVRFCILPLGVTLTDGFGVHNVAGGGFSGLIRFSEEETYFARFQVPTELQLKTSVFWDMTTCRLMSRCKSTRRSLMVSVFCRDGKIWSMSMFTN